MYKHVFVSDSNFIYYLDNNKLLFFPVILGLLNSISFKIFNLNYINNINLEDSILILIKSFITYFIYDYDKVYIYFFNLNGSIGYILIKYLNKLQFDIDIIIQNGIIYSIIINKDNNIIHIKNLNLILPYSINNSIFLFNNFYKNINYKFPIFTLDLLSYYQNILNLYIINHLFILFELLINYNHFINNIFNLNIYNILTLPGLSNVIYFNKYFKYKFESLSLMQDNFIRRSYFGGICDIYLPYGLDLVILDFNSMYPYIMKNTKFPIDTPYFISEISNLKDFCLKTEAFIYVDVFCKDNLNYPLIMFNYNGLNIQPTGYFSQVVWSKEILFCLNNYPTKYEFKFNSALYFKKSDYIFNEFITDYYIKKLQYPTLSNFFKLFMNSLYGRFGMNLNLNFTDIISKDVELDFINKNDIIINNTQILNDDFSLINYTKEFNFNILQNSNIRIDWASIITSESRILIQQLKELVNIYYIDTDCLIISSKDLSKLFNFINNTSLGSLKILGYYDECIFLAPKVYLLRNKFNFFVYFKGFNQDILNLSDNDLYLLFKLSLYNNINLLNNNDLINYLSKYFYSFLFSYTKRLKIYDQIKWIKTKPLKLKNKN